jgi:chemotaxis protein methyltransferase CheR
MVDCARIPKTTTLFRDVPCWHQILSWLANRTSISTSVWVSACSNGAEAFSYAMLMADTNVPGKILATDADQHVLDVARNPRFNDHDIDDISGDPPLDIRYIINLRFGFTIADSIRDRVSFNRHNLLEDPYPTGNDMICCRNVLRYMDVLEQREVGRGFVKALNPSGLLFIGTQDPSQELMRCGFVNHPRFGHPFYITVKDHTGGRYGII